MPRLTDKQEKEILEAHANRVSNVELAKRYGVSETTIRRVLSRHPQTARIVEDKKQSNTNDILAHMDSKKDTVNEIIDKALEVLNDKHKLAKTSPMQIATMLGIVIDKFTGTRHVVEKLRADVARNSVETKEAVEDDPITKALKEEKENGLL